MCMRVKSQASAFSLITLLDYYAMFYGVICNVNFLLHLILNSKDVKFFDIAHFVWIVEPASNEMCVLTVRQLFIKLIIIILMLLQHMLRM